MITQVNITEVIAIFIALYPPSLASTTMISRSQFLHVIFYSLKEHIDKHEPWDILPDAELPEVRIRGSELLAAKKEAEPEEDKDAPPGTAGEEEIFDMSADQPG